MTETSFLNRRQAMVAAAGVLAGGVTARDVGGILADEKVSAVTASGKHVHQADDVKVLLPRDRVPVSFVIDDSTCLVNMGHFCTPQFATAFPDRDEYKKPWREWPREIPDEFVREFGKWSTQHEVKGKYSIVPNPACVGWLDRELPGWTRRELKASLDLVWELMVPNWDIHPEMITHTRVINLKTGRPFNEISKATMENSYPQEKKSVDELAAYLAYALRILKNCGLPCEGVTTPGGFGNAVKKELPVAVHQAVRDVFGTELPHYFKYVELGEATSAKLENLSGVGTSDVQVTANVPAATGDWFGGWQGIRDVERNRYLSPDGQSGRMADLIRKRQPAVMLCHWPGMYNNGTKVGFHAFQSIVKTIAQVYGDQTMWMKLSEIGRYQAAKELTQIELETTGNSNTVKLDAPFAAANFTLQVQCQPSEHNRRVTLSHAGKSVPLSAASSAAKLVANTYVRSKDSLKVCFDLPKGTTKLAIEASRS